MILFKYCIKESRTKSYKKNSDQGKDGKEKK